MTWVLGIETSGPETKVALYNPETGDSVEKVHESPFEHAEKINLLFEELGKQLNVGIKDISLVSLSIGPGYFTALRVGASFAKAFHLVTGTPLRGVNTLLALAHDAEVSNGYVAPLLNAQKGQVFYAVYKFENGAQTRTIVQPVIVNPDKILRDLKGMDVYFIGQGLEKHLDLFREKKVITDVPFPNATTIAMVGYSQFMRYGADNPLRLEPFYLRLPDAIAKDLRGGILVRNATYRDLDRVLDIEQVSFPSPWSRTAFENELHKPISLFLVAQVGEDVAGYIIAYHYAESSHIVNIAVAPEYRRHGIGRRLLERAIEEARMDNLDFVFLEVRASSLPAQRLYESMGFRPIKRLPNYYSRELEDAIVYRLDLK